MISDKRTEFGLAFDIGQVVGTYLFTNQIDQSVIRDAGTHRPLYLVIIITEAVTTATTASVNFRLRSDDSASINPTTSSAHVETGAIDSTLLTLGKTIVIALPPGGGAQTYERYLGLQAVVAGATTTAGAATAFLTLDPPGPAKQYADASN